ncbi:hypothetical protein AOLI_G00030310 [Acnodon oligacanthus]
MAEDSSISVDHLQFSCSICLDLLKDPVTTPCGHSFCMVCINDFWDHGTQRGVYSCPQCREAFMLRPVLRRNNVMAEVVDKLKRKDLKSPSPVQYSSESGDVECDICSESKGKAIKSCLVCLASFCETHLKPHYDSPAFKKHKLVQACRLLQEKVCSCHDKLIEIYCRTDQKFICSLCMLAGHKGHDTASLAEERTEKQSQMRHMQRKFQQRIQEKQKKVQDLKQAVYNLKRSAQAAVEESERIFTELFLCIEQKCSEVKGLIRAQEKTEQDQAEGLLEQLEQEIADLKRKHSDLEQLSDTEDHIHFLQSFQSLYSASKAKDSARVTINQHVSFEGVRKSLSEFKDRLDEFCKEEFDKVNPYVVNVQMFLPFEPKTRDEFLQYFCHLTLDPNTANEALWLSENNRKLLKDPVTTPCGHSFCMVCINVFWDSERVYSCPQCRESFTPRPVLRRNNILAEVVKTLQESRAQDSLSDCTDFCPSEAQDVECDSCVGEKKKAVKSCLTCLASYCDTHLQPHHESAAFRKHKLVSAFRNLQEKTCGQHDKLLEVFCRTDKRVICSLCLLDKHKGHNTVSVQEEWMEKKKKFEDLERKYQNRLEKRETILLELKELMESFKSSAQAAVEDSERIFTELILSMEKKRSEATELIRAREKAELDNAMGFMEQLEQEIAELNRKQTNLQQLSVTKDYIQLVQRSQILCADPEEANDAFKIGLNRQPAFENFKTSVLQLKKQLETFCTEEWQKISENVNDQIISDPEAETREDFLKYARELTLDPNTVNCNLLLLESNRKSLLRCQLASFVH